MAKTDWIAHQRKADELWNDIDQTSDNLKELAKSTRAIQGEAGDRLSQIAEKIRASKDGKEARQMLSDFEVEFKDSLSDKELRKALQALDSQLDEMEEAQLNKLPYERRSLSKLEKYLDSVRVNGNDKGVSSGVVSFRKMLIRASGFLGTRQAIGGILSSLKEAPGRAYASTINKALQLAGDNKMAVKAVQAADNIARTVKLVGVESLKWLGKKIKGLGMVLWRLAKLPGQIINAGVSMLGGLIGVAALVPFAWQMLKEMNARLEKEYGEGYLRKWLGDAWEKSKAETQEALQQLPTKIKEIMGDLSTWSGQRWDEFYKWSSEQWKGLSTWVGQQWSEVRTWVGTQWDGFKNWMGEKLDAFLKAVLPKWAQPDRLKETDSKPGATASGGSVSSALTANVNSNITNSTLDYSEEMPNPEALPEAPFNVPKTAPEKVESWGKWDAYMKKPEQRSASNPDWNRVDDGSIPVPVAQSLRTQNIFVPEAKVQKASRTSSGVVTQSSGAVTAKPPPKPSPASSSSEGQSPAGQSSSSSSSSLGVRHIPKEAGGELLQVMNQGQPLGL